MDPAEPTYIPCSMNPNSLLEMDISSLTITSSQDVHVSSSSSSYIPDDIVFSILSKLPIISLKRFACVRKSWSLLCINPCFKTMYVSKNHSYYDNTSLLLHVNDTRRYDFYSLSGERFENRVELNWPKVPPHRHVRGASVMPIIHGFEILRTISFHSAFCDNEEFILWNWTTKQLKIIDLPLDETNHLFNVSAHHHQLGYDHVRDDYKMNSLKSNHLHFWEMYSLKSNTWRKINDDIPHSYICGEEVYLDGVSHRWETNETQTYLVSFDFIKECFIIKHIPSSNGGDPFDFYLTEKRLWTVLNGSIAFIVTYTETSTLFISILGELGVKESWTKLFIVGPLSCLDYPVGAGKKGNILIRKKDNKLAWFDLSTRMIDETGVTVKDYSKILFLPIDGRYSNFFSCFHP